MCSLGGPWTPTVHSPHRGMKGDPTGTEECETLLDPLGIYGEVTTCAHIYASTIIYTQCTSYAHSRNKHVSMQQPPLYTFTLHPHILLYASVPHLHLYTSIISV